MTACPALCEAYVRVVVDITSLLKVVFHISCDFVIFIYDRHWSVLYINAICFVLGEYTFSAYRELYVDSSITNTYCVVDLK